ncbi:hypothetical protein MXD81_56630 [Microbacteriaceae bacterium K1510]|nr:hypothetical protein [Microbacteriaceae bacterium K1510]
MTRVDWLKRSALLAATVLTFVPAFADDVPRLDVGATCRAGAEAYPGGGGEKACLADEQDAHTTLTQQWSQYSAESRTRCTRMVSDIPGTQSYIELLSCLEMAKDAQRLPKDKL